MTETTFSHIKEKTADAVEEAVTTGPAAASMISGGAGVFVIGLMTTLAEASEGIKTALNWLGPVGPLSGKTGVGILFWLISWFFLNMALKDKESNLAKAFAITVALMVTGLLLTFPPIFLLFASH